MGKFTVCHHCDGNMVSEVYFRNDIAYINVDCYGCGFRYKINTKITISNIKHEDRIVCECGKIYYTNDCLSVAKCPAHGYFCSSCYNGEKSPFPLSICPKCNEEITADELIKNANRVGPNGAFNDLNLPYPYIVLKDITTGHWIGRNEVNNEK